MGQTALLSRKEFSDYLSGPSAAIDIAVDPGRCVVAMIFGPIDETASLLQ